MRTYLTILFFISCITGLSAQSATAEAARAYLRLQVEQGHTVGMAAAISSPDGILWEEAAGKTSLDGTSSFTITTVNRTASIAKIMTAVAVLQLQEWGILHVDDPVGKYLPAFAQGPKADITVRQVLGHTAGIRAYANSKERENYVHYPTLEAALEIFREDELLFPPGTDFNYTSYGYTVLGLLIEKLSGKSFAAYLQENIWEPAGMSHTAVETSDNKLAKVYHQKKPGKFKALKTTDLSDRIPAGGIVSTVEDLLHFGDALVQGKILSAESLAEMSVNHGLKKEGNGYGMGLYLYGERPLSGNTIGHTGAQIGVSAVLLLLPERKTTVVVLANTSGAMNPVFSTGVKLLGVADELVKE